MGKGGRPSTDRVGQRFGRIVITKQWRDVDRKRTHCDYVCDCGRTGTALMGQVVAGNTRSCGCLVKDTRVSPIVDRKGARYGRLIVVALEPEGRGPAGQRMWRCVCHCGNEIVVSGGALHSGNTKSCGCLHADVAAAGSKHGMYGSAEYRAWAAAKQRCHNPKDRRYADYGGRGITMCDEWRDDFAAFLKYIGPRPPGHSLDRFPDNDAGYAPGNVRWATSSEQQNNRRKRSVT